jgi:hypothetical protein
MSHRPANTFKTMSENQKIKSVLYAKNMLPLTVSNDWLQRYLTIYCEKIRSKTSFGNALQYGVTDASLLKNVPEFSVPTIDFSLFERIKFDDGMPRILIALFGLMIGNEQAVQDAFQQLKQKKMKNK